VQVAFSVTHAPYTRFDALALRNFRHDHPEEWPPLSDDEVARFVKLYEDNHLRLQWDFPKAVRELGLGPTEVSALAAVLEAHYKARVRLLDHCFGRVLQRIREAGLLEESLIAFTADHGETLYREDTLFKWTHGLELHPDTIEVPLIVRLPGAQPLRGSYDGISRSIDVYPTLAGLSGFSVGTREGVDGLDLSAAVRGRMRPASLRAFSHTTLLGPELVEQFRGWGVSRYHPSTGKEHLWASVRDDDVYARLRKNEDGDWGVDLFRLGDPRGPAPMLFDDRQRAHRDLVHELEGYKARLRRAYEDQGRERARLDPDARERLRSLGYIQ
jgi:arylsulfatase A-like enzyme